MGTAAGQLSDLTEFVSSLAGGDGFRVEESLGDGFVRLRVSEAERRQAKHDIRCVEDAVIELLRNARDAGATRIFVASSREGDMRTVTVVDDGSGIPPEMHRRVFDARVTSKLDTMSMDRWGVHGRGMALFSIRENALDARIVDSALGKGCALQATFDVSAITERADQSTWPTVKAEGGTHVVRGPRNIVRACVEFALETEGRCNVYVGSGAEVVATMRARVRPQAASYGAGSLLDPLSRPAVERPALASDARDLRDMAASLGIAMSERNAHRIIRGEIAPLRNVRTQVLHKSARVPQDAATDNRRKIPLSATDREEFSRLMQEAFAEVCERYYVRPTGVPKVVSGEGRLMVVFEFEEDE